MSEWTVYSGNRILRILFGTDQTLKLNVHSGEGYVNGAFSGDVFYINDDVPTLRPDLNLPTTKQLTINEDWVVGTLPEGTRVYIDRTLVGETDETELVLSFPLAQTYSVKFEPPFPYKPHEMEVVVNEANT